VNAASLADLVPEHFLVRELRGNRRDWDFPILPAEEPMVARAVPARRAEFSAVRFCARSLLAELGRPETAILSDRRGAPLWPTGVVGSMTHTRGYCAVTLTDRQDYRSIGVDAEPHLPLPDPVRAVVAGKDDEAHLRWLSSRSPGPHWETIMFSAKEAVYKAWYPVTHEWLGFDDITVCISPGEGLLTAEVRGTASPGDGSANRRFPRRFHGRFAVGDDLVLTSIVLSSDPGSAQASRSGGAPVSARAATPAVAFSIG
jgi:4'-phosphopantetheinyl transferase EntD